MAMPQPSLPPPLRQSSSAILENIAQAQDFLIRAFSRDCIGSDGILRDADGCHEAITAAVRHLLKAQRCLVETPWPVEINWPAEAGGPAESARALPAPKPEQSDARTVEGSTNL